MESTTQYEPSPVLPLLSEWDTKCFPSSAAVSASKSLWDNDGAPRVTRSSFLTVPSPREVQFRQRQHHQQCSSSSFFNYRERADSFGSTGSGATDMSSSPQESYWSSGQTTASRGSPVGSPLATSSPPLTQGGNGSSSKLLNILLGNITFNDNLAAYVERRRSQQTPHIQVNIPSPEHRPSSVSSNSDLVALAACRGSNCSSPDLPRRLDCKRLAYSKCDSPIDLTCKKTKTSSLSTSPALNASHLNVLMSESLDRNSTRSTASLSPSPVATPVPEILTGNSSPPQRSGTILQSLLMGGNRQTSRTTETNERSFSKTNEEERVFVCLAKRNQRHVLAHINNWLGQVARFALEQDEFRQLKENVALNLLLSTFPRLLLIYMAETNFHFAVTQVRVGPNVESTPLHSGDAPTMQTVEAIQAFISRCEQLKVDTVEFGLMKLAALFNTSGDIEVPREAVAYREVVMSRARISLLDYVQRTQVRHEYRARYSSLLLSLHLLSGISTNAVRQLFCADLVPDHLVARLRDLLHHSDVNGGDNNATC